MAIFEDLSKKLKKVVKIAGEKTDEIIETGKIKYDIYKEEEEVKRLFSEIGKTVYIDFQKGVNYSSELEKFCRQVVSHQESIRLLKEKDEEVRSKAQGKEMRRSDEDLAVHEETADSQSKKDDENKQKLV